MGGRRLVRITSTSGDLMAALEAAALPLADLSSASAIYQFEDEAGPIGWAALEVRDNAALLRSVVVPQALRGSGAGAEMVRAVIRRAAEKRISELWLLTQTATPFFARQGFVVVDRATAPAAIRATSEFASICPASADCMTLKLRAA